MKQSDIQYNLRDILSSKKEKIRSELLLGASTEEAYSAAQVNNSFNIFGFLHSVGLSDVGLVVEVGSSYAHLSQFRDEILRVSRWVERTSRDPACKAASTQAGWRPTNFALIDVREEACFSLQYAFGHFPNVEVYNIGISDINETKTMVWKEGSTYEKGTESPHVQNFSNTESTDITWQVNCVTFDKLDQGNIGVLAADVEGNEYHIIKAMKSRPIIIGLELATLECTDISTTKNKNCYINPFIDEISQWMNENHYMPLNFSQGDVTFIRIDYYNELKKRGIYDNE